MMTFPYIDDPQNKEASGSIPGCWIPTEKVGCHLIKAPDIGAKKLLNMVPWLLEEHVLSSSEQLAWVSGKRIDGDLLPVITIEKALLEQWRQELNERGIHCEKLVPDFFMLPWQQGTVSLSCNEGRLLVRSGPFSGMAGPLEWLKSILFHELDKDLVLHVYGAVPDRLRESCPLKIVSLPAPGEETQPQQPWLGFTGVRGNREKMRLKLPMAICASLVVALLVVLPSVFFIETARMNQKAHLIEEALGKAVGSAIADKSMISGKGLDAYFSRIQESSTQQTEQDPMTLVKRANKLLADCPNCKVTELSLENSELTVSLEATASVEEWFASQNFTDQKQRVILNVAEDSIRLKITNPL